MKKLTLIILTLTIMVSLVACNDNSDNVIVNTPQNSAGTTTPSNSESGDNSDENSSSTSDSPEISVDPKTQAFIDAFALDSFTAPDSSTVNKSEAVYAAGSEESGVVFTVGFDFSYMRYAEPLFDNTFDNPDLFDWEDTLAFNTDVNYMLENPNYFKVKSGDTLENGLTVESAQYWINTDGSVFSSEIILNGELTLEGIFRCIKGNAEYIEKDGDLLFYADSNKNHFVPVAVTPVDWVWGWIDTNDSLAVVYDGTTIKFGNINDASTDIVNVFKDVNYVKAAVTMNNIRLIYQENGGAFFIAELVSVDVIG